MSQTLLETAKDWPMVENCLFVGGPHHGQYWDVIQGDKFTQKLTYDTDTVVTVHTYRRQTIALPVDERTGYKRDVFVHDEIPSQEVAQQALVAALMTSFVMGGEKVDVVQPPTD